MSDCPEAALPAAPCDPSADARVARLKTFERDRLIVDCLNRGVSVAGIAARVGAGDKRMRALVVTIARNTCRKTLKKLIQRPGSLVLIPGQVRGCRTTLQRALSVPTHRLSFNGLRMRFM